MLEVKNLSVSYADKTVLDGINLTFEKGKFYCIIGRNGAGKSTLAKSMAHLVKYNGRVLCDGIDISKMSLYDRAKKISVLFQSQNEVPFTAHELVCFGRTPYGDIKTKGEELAKSAMEAVGITHLHGKKVSSLSGGERQLSYFAMSLCQDADIMILDEPAASLDMEYSKRILDIAKERTHDAVTVICVLHNLSDAVRYADEIVILDKGKCVFSGSKETCLEKEMIEKNFGVRRFCTDGKIFFSI